MISQLADSDIVDENKEIISDDEADVDDNMVFSQGRRRKILNHILKNIVTLQDSKSQAFFYRWSWQRRYIARRNDWVIQSN